uniref:Uncharacterized protein n=1 Tax=Timema tahoe TaxID=61484 RepID=A0A7R9IMN9_9NEOP|nr:unnamed protein product [Timema tahoe]
MKAQKKMTGTEQETMWKQSMSIIQPVMRGTTNVNNILLRPNMSERNPAGIAPSRAPTADREPSQEPSSSVMGMVVALVPSFKGLALRVAVIFIVIVIVNVPSYSSLFLFKSVYCKDTLEDHMFRGSLLTTFTIPLLYKSQLPWRCRVGSLSRDEVDKTPKWLESLNHIREQFDKSSYLSHFSPSVSATPPTGLFPPLQILSHRTLNHLIWNDIGWSVSPDARPIAHNGEKDRLICSSVSSVTSSSGNNVSIRRTADFSQLVVVLPSSLYRVVIMAGGRNFPEAILNGTPKIPFVAPPVHTSPNLKPMTIDELLQRMTPSISPNHPMTMPHGRLSISISELFNLSYGNFLVKYHCCAHGSFTTNDNSSDHRHMRNFPSQGIGFLKTHNIEPHLLSKLADFMQHVFVTDFILTNRLLAKLQLVLYLFPGLPVSLRHQKPDEEDPKEHTDTVGAVSHRETHDVDHVGETFGDQEHKDPVKADRSAGDEASGLTRSKFGHHQPGQGPHAELETDHKHVECQERHPAVLTHVDLRLVEVRVDGHGRQTYGSPTRVVDNPGRGESSHQLHEGYYNGAEVRRQGGARVAENVDGVVHEGAGAAHLLQEHEPEYYVGSFERRGRGGDALNALPNLLEQRDLLRGVCSLTFCSTNMSMIQLMMSGTANISNILLRPNMSERNPAGIAPSRAPTADRDPSQEPSSSVMGIVVAFVPSSKECGSWSFLVNNYRELSANYALASLATQSLAHSLASLTTQSLARSLARTLVSLAEPLSSVQTSEAELDPSFYPSLVNVG